jgi:hypothetical protein
VELAGLGGSEAPSKTYVMKELADSSGCFLSSLRAADTNGIKRVIMSLDGDENGTTRRLVGRAVRAMTIAFALVATGSCGLVAGLGDRPLPEPGTEADALVDVVATNDATASSDVGPRRESTWDAASSDEARPPATLGDGDLRADADAADAAADVGPDAGAAIDDLAIDGAVGAEAGDGGVAGDVDVGNSETTGGGRVLVHPEIALTFWGSQWVGPQRGRSAQIVGAVQDIVNGPYLAMLNQYGGIALGRVVPAVNYSTATPPPTAFHDANVTAMLDADLAAGSLPPPSPFADLVYVDVLPQGSSSVDHPACEMLAPCVEYHGFSYQGANVYWIWVIDDGGELTGSASVSSLIARELVDTVTNPEGNGFTPGIGARCHGQGGIQNGHSLPAYWSDADGRCLLPSAWFNVWQYNGAPDNWTQIGGYVRQIYAGADGLVATDTNDMAMLYSGTPMVWNGVGDAGSMFAVGKDSILALTIDTSAVMRYDGSQWSRIGDGAVAVYAGSELVSIDYTGQASSYSVTSQTWTEFGSRANQYIANDGYVAALAWDHQSVSIFSGGSWAAVGGPASELFSGGIGAPRLAQTALDSQRRASLWQSGTSWLDQGDAAYMFAVTGDVQIADAGAGVTLSALVPNRSAVLVSTDLSVAGPPWNRIGGSASRLVSQGEHLYATGGVVY